MIFVIEDTTTTINKYNGHHSDSNAFVFSLKSNGRINGMMKFNITNSSYDNALAVDRKTGNSYLFGFVSGWDICVRRKGRKINNDCYQSGFYYEGMSCSLCSSIKSGYQEFLPKKKKIITSYK